ncbi:hypothetical protein ANAEL_02305 [Anaerolineales bacterium]|nr:hypothetical protein ANAEL_02305 [Anaerolineales bacterium]
MKRRTFPLLILILSALACNMPSVQVITPTSPPPVETQTRAFTSTLETTSTPEATLTPTITFTSTITLTPTISATPTFAFPKVTVNKQAHCRYGPSVAFLHAADLYPGDTGIADGRFEYSSWLHVKFDKLNYYCWVAPSVVDVVGDVSTLRYNEPDLQSIGYSNYPPPQNIRAVRNGDEITINWDQVNMKADHDRGYLIIAFVCQDGNYLWWTDSYPDQYSTSYTVRDEAGCPVPSEGVLYTVEKHGFSKPAQIPWPAP